MRIQLLLTIGIFIVFTNTNAQQYHWQANVPKIAEDGFYKIQIEPEITAKLQAGFPDIRIIDNANVEVPYILKHEIPVEYKTLFNEYKIIERKYKKHWGYSRIVIHNPDKSEIRSLSLIIRNTDVSKWLKINGSDNNNDWFALKDNYYFHSFYHNQETSEIKILDFPVSNYEYYELLISDFFNKPIQVLKVGYFDTKTEEGKYSEIPTPEIQQAEKDKQSIVTFNFAESQYIDKLAFEVSGAEFFYRPVQLFVEDFRTNKKHEKEKYERLVIRFHLNSSNTNELKFDKLHGKNFTLIVENFDDQPLSINKIKTYQLSSYTIARLKPDLEYKLKFGNPDVNAPFYDIRFFQDSIPPDLPVLKVGNPVPAHKLKTENKDTKQENTVVMWSALVFIMLFLIYMSSRMIREMMGKGKKT